MYKMLIVEDEPLELQALTRLAGANVGRIGEIYQAQNGCDALALALAHVPDVILMDINIPGRSGLDVLEELRQNGYAGSVVILTAYGRFEYAQAALRAEACDYLLKPIDEAELTACLNRIFDRLDASGQELRRCSRVEQILSNLKPIVLKSLLEGGDAESDLQSLYGWPQDGALHAFFLEFFLDTPLSQDDLRCLYFDFFDLCPRSFLLIADLEPERIRIAMECGASMEDAEVELTLWCMAIRMEQLVGRRDQRFRLWCDGPFRRYADFVQCQAECPKGVGIRLPMEALLRGAPLGARDSRMYFQKALSRCRAGMPERMISLYRKMIQSPETRWHGLFSALKVLNAHDPELDVLSAFRYATERNANMASALAEWIEMNDRSVVEPGEGNFMVRQAMEIIREEYADSSLSQSDVAGRLGLSPAYFSRLFKREMGETFISCLTSIRLDRARELLAEGRDVAEIASACGYQSRKYFLDAFRQNQGYSVSRYLDEVNPK